ncbi:MAG: hypothetical protein U9N56_01680, partial [Actinomycetota bacterium]|nr:hypothetical protein [Actinomycetota bacterium]
RDAGIRVHVRSSFNTEPGTWLTEDAPAMDLVGLAHHSEGDVGTITIVGTAAKSRADDAFELLLGEGIDVRDGGQVDRQASLRVHVERIPDALRSLHEEFFETEMNR